MSEVSRQPSPSKVVSLPQTRKISWISVGLEYTHVLVLALWLGGQAFSAFFVGPSLYRSLQDPNAAAWSNLDLQMNLHFLAGGAGAFLLLTTLLMYLLALRSPRSTMIQTALLLGMTVSAVANHVVVAPQMAELLRSAPDLLSQTANPEFARYEGLGRISAGLLGVQLILGSLLLFFGVRRWYRYVDPETARHSGAPVLRLR